MINNEDGGDNPGVSEPVPPPFGPDLRIDSDDDENLERLPEIERELILSERHETYLRYREEKTLYDRLMGKEPEQETKKESKPLPGQGRKKSGPSPSLSSDSSESGSESSSDSGSEFSSDSAGENEEIAVGRLASRKTEKEIAESMDVTLTRENALKLQLSRDQLLSVFQDVPAELRDEALLDSLVRVPSGEENNYLICRVVGATASVSKLPETSSFDLMLEWPSGDGSTSVPVSSVSNTELTETELSNWISWFGLEASKQLARKVGRKQSQVRQLKEFVWDDRTINRMLSKKKSSSVKLTLEVAKLRTALQAELGVLNSASSSESQRASASESISRINKEIAELEGEFRANQQAFADANTHQFGIVAINHRNRTEQRMQDIEEARKRQRSAHSSPHEKSSELNPFKRRECKPTVMWDVGKRSPKKTHSQESPVMNDIQDAPLEYPVLDKKPVISDLISVEKLVSAATAALAKPGSRLNTARRSMRAEYSKEISPVWGEQLSGIQPGEIMEFKEWKRRVAEDMVLD